MPMMSSLEDMIQLRKESVCLMMGLRNFPDWNVKEKRIKKKEKKIHIPELWENFKKCNICIILVYHIEKRKNRRSNILSNIIWELPKLATDVKPLVQEVQNSKKDEYWQNKAKLCPGISYSDCWKPKTREDLERNQRKMLTTPYP